MGEITFRTLREETPHRRAQTSCVRFFVLLRIENTVHIQSAQTATVPLVAVRGSSHSFHGTVCFICLPAPVPVLLWPRIHGGFPRLPSLSGVQCVPLPPTARWNRCHGKVPFVYLHGRLFTFTRSSSIAPNVNSTCRLLCRCCSKREYFPLSIYRHGNDGLFLMCQKFFKSFFANKKALRFLSRRASSLINIIVQRRTR